MLGVSELTADFFTIAGGLFVAVGFFVYSYKIKPETLDLQCLFGLGFFSLLIGVILNWESIGVGAILIGTGWLFYKRRFARNKEHIGGLVAGKYEVLLSTGQWAYALEIKETYFHSPDPTSILVLVNRVLWEMSKPGFIVCGWGVPFDVKVEASESLSERPISKTALNNKVWRGGIKDAMREGEEYLKKCGYLQ